MGLTVCLQHHHHHHLCSWEVYFGTFSKMLALRLHWWSMHGQKMWLCIYTLKMLFALGKNHLCFYLFRLVACPFTLQRTNLWASTWIGGSIFDYHRFETCLCSKNSTSRHTHRCPIQPSKNAKQKFPQSLARYPMATMYPADRACFHCRSARTFMPQPCFQLETNELYMWS